jgi:sorbitol-specific phosphotransferase system component IIC
MTTITHIEPWTLARLQAAIAFVVGLVFGLVQWLLVVVLGSVLHSVGANLPTSVTSPTIPGLGAFASVGFIGFVFFAVVAGVIGLISGAITAIVYNFMAKRGGGLKVELSHDDA